MASAFFSARPEDPSGGVRGADGEDVRPILTVTVLRDPTTQDFQVRFVYDAAADNADKIRALAALQDGLLAQTRGRLLHIEPTTGPPGPRKTTLH